MLEDADASAHIDAESSSANVLSRVNALMLSRDCSHASSPESCWLINGEREPESMESFGLAGESLVSNSSSVCRCLNTRTEDFTAMSRCRHGIYVYRIFDVRNMTDVPAVPGQSLHEQLRRLQDGHGIHSDSGRKRQPALHRCIVGGHRSLVLPIQGPLVHRYKLLDSNGTNVKVSRRSTVRQHHRLLKVCPHHQSRKCHYYCCCTTATNTDHHTGQRRAPSRMLLQIWSI
jgi:hypothetical protein